jgi:hypothetical protein
MPRSPLAGITRTAAPQRYRWDVTWVDDEQSISAEQIAQLAAQPVVNGTFRVDDDRRSLTDPNVANRIHRWLERNWPELVHTSGLWFTGSSVWSHLYGRSPNPASDLDVIAETSVAHGALKIALANLIRDPKEGEKTATSLGGERIYIKGRSSVDIWQSRNPVEAIKGYSLASHAHARACYSTTLRALVVLPNEEAW